MKQQQQQHLTACRHCCCHCCAGVRGLQLSAGCLDDAPQLETFSAARAGLEAFPEPLLACSNLARLNLGGNRISSLPADVTQLSRLSELDVSNCELNGLPPQIGLMAGHLRMLLLSGNPLRTIRRPLLDKGTAALLEWLRDRIPLRAG